MARQQGQRQKKRKSSSTLLWGLLGLVILVAGVASALYYMNRERIETDARLRVIKDFVTKVDETIEKGKTTLGETIEKGKSATGLGRPEGEPAAMRETAPPPPAPLFGDGVRSYRVKKGETLWRIAEESGLVDNPWEWRTILVQNQDQIEWAFINDEEQAWKIMMAEGQTLTVDPGDPGQDMAPAGEKFAVQLASVSGDQRRRAEFVVRLLMRDGYYGYVYRHVEGGRTWFRVRSGFYDSEARARAVGRAIKERYTEPAYFPDELWVLKPSRAEQRGTNVVFGAQLTNPWVVELGDRETHGAAVRELRRVRGTGELAYIWQTRDPLSKRFVYRVRIGYFASEEEARAAYAGRSGELWEPAHPVKVEKLEETLPGQHIVLGGLSS